MSIKLIIIDDAPFIREVVRHMLSATEIEVIGEATNGEEGVLAALTLRPDVILMDLVMPGKSGIEATREIIQDWPEAKILACSTLDQTTVVEKALDIGCRYFITKPFEYDELIRLIRKTAS